MSVSDFPSWEVRSRLHTKAKHRVGVHHRTAAERFCHTSTKLPGLQRSSHKVDVRCALRVICGVNGLEHEEHRQ